MNIRYYHYKMKLAAVFYKHKKFKKVVPYLISFLFLAFSDLPVVDTLSGTPYIFKPNVPASTYASITLVFRMMKYSRTSR